MARATDADRPTCLARTCLKWTPDGELSEDDKRLVLNRLREVDRPVAELLGS
jgi:hypothetical protein